MNAFDRTNLDQFSSNKWGFRGNVSEKGPLSITAFLEFFIKKLSRCQTEWLF
jgi:hypothetical protein